MDPLAHTLLGATLAETRLRERTAGAALALVLGANLPDIDAVTMFADRDVSLYWRRGHTHGVLGLLLLPPLLAWLLWAVHGVRRRRRPELPPASFRALLGLSYLGTFTHPVLDWLNSYGVRLLMPFDGTWFYGDAVFIVDPWLWLLGAASVVLARARGPLGTGVWLILASAASWLVGTHELAPTGVRIAWFAGVSALAAWRWRGVLLAGVPRVAAIVLCCIALYIGANVATSIVARRQIGAALAAAGLPVAQVVVSPVAAQPLLRQATVVLPDAYHFYSWRLGGAIEVTRPPRVRRPLDPVALAATRAPELRGLMNWLRLRELEVVAVPEGYRVAVHDMRPGRRRDTERARVWLSPSLQILRVER